MSAFNFGSGLTCPSLPSPVTDAAPILAGGSLTVTQLSEYIAGISMGIACLAAFLLIFLHATHLSRPAEQIKIIRITALIPVFAIVSFVNIYLGQSAVYLTPWVHVAEAISLATFFVLVCDLASPKTNERVEAIEMRPKDDAEFPAEGWAWAKRTRIATCQYIAVTTFIAVVTDVTQATGRFCINSNNPRFAHVWMTIINAVSAALAIIAIIVFTKIMSRRIPKQRLMVKLISFKLIVLLDFVQTIVFSVAGARFTPSVKLSYLDLTVSVPAMILCLEMVSFSFLFHFTYSYRPYVVHRPSNAQYHGGPLGIFAIGKAFNLIFIFREIADSL